MRSSYNRNARELAQAGHWQDVANLVLATWLFLSPWILGFVLVSATAAGAAAPGPNLSNASWNAWVLGILIVLLAIAALSGTRLWQEWLQLLLGVWLFIAPWVLGFSAAPAAAWDHWIVGILVVVCAASKLQAFGSARPVTVASGLAGNKPLAGRNPEVPP